MIIIITIIIYIIIIGNKSYKYLNNNTKIEIIFALIPGIILILIGVPSIKLLYMNENKSKITLEIKGRQWFWNYIYKDYNIEIDAYTKEEGILRLLKTDNYIVLPTLIPIRLLITSDDVIHSFTIPNIGIKLDTNPGRINTTTFILLKEGLYFGQCSELCGSLRAASNY